MRNFLQRIANAIRREPAAFQRMEQGGQMGDVPRGRQGHLLDEGKRSQR